MKAKRLAAALIALLVAAPLVEAQDPAPESEVDHAAHSHAMVRITRARLDPEVARLSPADAIVFLNYSSRIAQITFEPGAAEKIRCATPTSFGLVDGRLKAEYVREGTFATLCSFQPGDYPYLVELKTAPGVTENERTLRGTLRVQP
jgi:hypothetical protein